MLEKYKDAAFSCMKCGFCFHFGYQKPYFACPSYEVNGFESYGAKGKIVLARSILDGTMKYDSSVADRVFACTLCGACETRCHNNIPTTDMFETFRYELDKAGFGLQAHQNNLEEINRVGNPYGKTAPREAWLEGTALPKKGNVLYFGGCTYPYLSPKTGNTILSVLMRTGQRMAYLGSDEGCCGSYVLRTGYRDAFRELAEKNVRAFRTTGCSTIVTPCPGCYRTLKKDYPQYVDGFDFEVLHATEMLADAINAGKIESPNRIDVPVTYHDPCHLDRHMKMFEPPRMILESIAGGRFIEMERVKENGYCCGAGGGMRAAYKNVTNQITARRVEEAEATGAQALVTNCPFCEIAFGEIQQTSRLKFYNIFELFGRRAI
jgi:Fe-S oxidoreductase